jgi:serine/threonine protein phosphatase PrpC
MEHEERHLVSNIVGSQSTHFEVGSPRTMAQRDTLLLASDGVFDNFLEEEIAQFTQQGSIRDVCETLVTTAQERMQAPSSSSPSKPDDIALMLFRR